MFYRITAHAVTTIIDDKGERWQTSHAVPTFYLHRDVHGIVDVIHAERIAKRMIAALVTLTCPGHPVTVHAYATPVERAEIDV